MTQTTSTATAPDGTQHVKNSPSGKSYQYAVLTHCVGGYWLERTGEEHWGHIAFRNSKKAAEAEAARWTDMWETARAKGGEYSYDQTVVVECTIS